MNLIVCLDDKNGMLFHNRRQSSDAVVCRQMIALVGNNRLWMNRYSAYLFADFQENIQVDEAFLDKAQDEDYCFVENLDVTPYLPLVKRVFVFRWNRIYPADLRFPIYDGKKNVLAEFAGNSHEKITLEEIVL